MIEIRYFFINLDRDEERRRAIESEAKRIGIYLERFPAYIGFDIPENLKPIFTKYKNRLSKGEIGCYASHLALCMMLQEDENYDFYAIFEDDVIFNSNFKCLIQKYHH